MAERLNVCPGREVSDHPSHVFARPADRAWLQRATACCSRSLCVRSPKKLWADPEEAACDLTSPYGYGGAFAWGGRKRDRGFLG